MCRQHSALFAVRLHSQAHVCVCVGVYLCVCFRMLSVFLLTLYAFVITHLWARVRALCLRHCCFTALSSHTNAHTYICIYIHTHIYSHSTTHNQPHSFMSNNTFHSHWQPSCAFVIKTKSAE